MSVFGTPWVAGRDIKYDWLGEVQERLGDVYGGVGSYDYKVEKEGTTTYIVRDKGGAKVGTGSTYEEVAIKEALDSLTSGRTWQEKVLLKGDFPDLDYPSGNTGCIDIPKHTHLVLNGKVTLANSVNKALIANADRSVTGYDNDVIIEGGVWDGNSGNQSSGHGIDWLTQGSYSTDYKVEFKYMRIRNIKDDGLHINTLVRLFAHHLEIRNCADYGMYLFVVADSYIHHIVPLEGSGGGAGHPSLFWTNGTSTFFDTLYINNCAEFKAVVRGIVSNILFDNKPSLKDKDNFVLNVVRNSLFNNIRFGIQESAGIVDKDAIKIMKYAGASDYSHDNVLNNIIAQRKEGTETNKFKYAIEETASNEADYNIFGIINGRDCATGALRILGANSLPASGNEHLILGTVVRT